MSDNKFLCVLAGYDDETQARLAALQNTLYAHGFIGTQTKDLLMHITLGTFKPEQEAQALKLVREVAEKHAPFELSLSHIGLFGGGEVLFVAPDLRAELAALREEFGASFGWTPHTTMLIDKRDVIAQALPVLIDSFQPLRGTVTSLHLYEFWPSRHITSFELAKG